MKNICITLGLVILMTSCNPESNLEINLQQSEIFLENNLLDSNVVEIEPGLQYVPKLSDTITADFHGTLMDGSIFWSSIEIGEPLTIQLSQLIPGCQKAISQMKVGDKWKVYIHPNLAYGEEGRPTIPPNAALTFDITLHSVEPIS